MAVSFTGFGGVQTSQAQPTGSYVPVAPVTGVRARKPMAPNQGGALISSSNGVVATSGGMPSVNYGPTAPMSDGVLGFLGYKPDQYAAARTSLANRGNEFTTDGFGGIQSNPANAPLYQQMAAQVAAQRPATTPAASIPAGSAGIPGASAGGGLGGAAGGASGGGLVQDVNLSQYQQNPYLSQMGDVLTNRVTDNLNRNILPGIRSNAVAAGGFGGSRQGVVEANAMKDANQGISDALTGAYFQDFTNQMNRNLAQYGQNQNFFSNQRGQDLQQTQLGANLFNMGNQGFLSQGQGIYGLGSQQQQAPWQVINNGNAGFGQWSGYGTTTSANQGGGGMGAVGGALAGGQLGNLWGRSPNAAGGVNSSGFGTGIGFGNQDFGQFF